MKKKQWMLAAILTISGAMVFSGCSETKDNPAVPVVPDQPSVVDNGKWTIDDSYMDISVKPGDNFFMYCNGTWWKNTTVSDDEKVTGFFRTTIGNSVKSKLQTLAYPNFLTLISHAEHLDETAEAAATILQEGVALLESSQTIEEAWRNTGILMAQGFSTPFEFVPFSINGHMALLFSFVQKPDFPIIPSDDGNDGEAGGDFDITQMLIKQPAKVLSRLTPIVKNTSRGLSSEWPMLAAVCEGAGIDPTDVYTFDTYAAVADPSFGEEDLEKLLQGAMTVQRESLEEYIKDCKEAMANDGFLLSSEDMADINVRLLPLNQVSLEQVISIIRDKYLKYEDSYHFANTYVSDQMKQQCKTMIAEFQEAFKKRLAENDWMSDATKHNVLEKLNNMTVNVGSPDTWFEEGLADLSQSQSMLEDLMLLRQAKLNLQARLAKMKTPDASFHALILETSPLTEVNAFYSPNYNSMNIMPVWMMSPAYDPEQSDAINYSNYAIVAHEITHGFDSEGAKYDKNGDVGSIWASEADAAEFQRRTQMLAEWFSTLEVLPEELPGVYNDGAFTLAENIADLGGFEMVYRAYVDKIKAQGFKGDELTKQLVKFYRGYGNLWRAKYTAQYADALATGKLEPLVEQDNHSLEKERLNGIVPNTDAWYELFDVKQGDKFYIAPENRVSIW